MTETVKTAKELAKVYYHCGIPSYTVGPPGVGKSELWEQIANELGIGFIDLRLAQLDPVDLRGLPIVRNEAKLSYTVWSRPEFWPVAERDGEEGIILLDELGDCGKAMQSAAYQVVLNKRAGPHEIPKGWYVAAAGNSQKHRAGAQPMSSALANRFAWIEVESDPDCWREYGFKVGFNPLVLGFIKMRPPLLHSMEGGTLTAFPTPRAWAKVSKIMDTDPDVSVRMKLIRGCVGDGAAGEFEAFMKTLDLPDFEEVLAQPKKCRVPREPAHRYALSAMLSYKADKGNFEKVMAYISREEFGRDFEICCVLDATKRDNTLTETKAFIEFANRNQDLALGS